LYGELLVLSKLHEHQVPLACVITAWTGSKKTNQDFEFGDRSVEVKSTAAVDTSSVSITNIRQLDDTGLKFLFLARVVLDARQGSESTLPVLINKLRTLVLKEAPERYVDLEQKLLDAGYRDTQVENYSNRTYAERSVDVYHVAGGFPRILERDPPDGVKNVSYSIDIELCAPHQISTEDAFEKIRESCDRKSGI